MVPVRMSMSTSWLAITPGNRLPMPESSMAVPADDPAGGSADGSATVVTDPPDCMSVEEHDRCPVDTIASPGHLFEWLGLHQD